MGLGGPHVGEQFGVGVDVIEQGRLGADLRAVPILERLDPEGDTVGALVLTATPEAADRLGESIARLSMVSGHSVAALGSPRSLHHHARIILGTTEAVLKEVAEGNLNLSSVKSFVLDQAQVLERLGTLDKVAQVMDLAHQNQHPMQCTSYPHDQYPTAGAQRAGPCRLEAGFEPILQQR